MRKQRFFVTLALIVLLVLALPVAAYAAEAGTIVDGMGYYEDGSLVRNDIIEVDGQLYAFDSDGYMFIGDAYEFTEYSVNDGWVSPKADGTLHVNEWAYQYGEKKAYYGPDGIGVRDFYMVDGQWYFFSYDGWMVRGEVVWSEVDPGWYWIDSDGHYTEMPAGKWFQDPWGDWYLPSADGTSPHDFVQVGGKWYYIGYNCRMEADTVVYSDMDKKWYALSEDGEEYYALSGEAGWCDVNGKWYYGIQDGDSFRYAYDDVIEENGKKYYMSHNGQMVANDLVEFYDYDLLSWSYAVADAGGVLHSSGWCQVDGTWQYLRDGQILRDCVEEINGKLYCFDWDGMVDEPGEHYYNGNYYRVSENDGELYRNRWYYREICQEYEKGWMYYGEDGIALRGVLSKIGNTWYGFNGEGVMYEDTIEEMDGGVYRFNADGKGTQLANGWYEYPVEGEWIYVQDGYLLTGLNQINGEYYYFYNDGSMVHNDWVYISGVYYLFDDNGAMLTRADTDHGNGWIYRDAWYFINEDNTLAEGWLQSGNSWYAMAPQMVQNTVLYEPAEGVTYAFESDGKAKALGDGLQTVDYGYEPIIVYIDNGKAITDAWKQIGGCWYYFDSNGHACRSGVRSVGGNRYLFNQYGQMQTGWAVHYGEWYYADPNNDSILVTGKQTIGGATYIFDAYGSMYYDCFCYYDGGIYRLATNGAVTKTLTEGWNQIGQDWYYVQDGSMVYDQMLQINGKYYFFDDEGKMLNGGLVYYYGSGFVTDADGALQTGWQKVNGKWVYAYPGSYRIIENGWEIIGDKRYFFDEDGFLRYGTINWYGSVYVTDADGAATYKEEVKSGWYLEDNGWYYYENGNAYDGWLGDYYLEDGYMVYDDIIEYNGRHYYLQPNGKLLRNGWAEYANYYWGEKLWILARADGSLYCSEWAQQGSTWYYFDGHYMAYDGVYNIGKEAHEFDEDGKWLGEVTDSSDSFANKPDGWLETRDGYYYILGGSPVYGEIYWQGDYYYLSGYDGLMIANSVNDTYYGSAQRYYDASGRAVEYVDWKQIGGNWYYFNQDHTVYFGLASDSQGLCYVYPYYTDDGKIVSKLAKKEYVAIGSSLYYFDANGYTKGAISHNGWYNADGEWYYFENGALVGYGYREIGGVGYYFYGGLMAHDETVTINGNAYYVNKDGAVVTRKGWYQLNGEWIYVKDGGHLIEYGIYIIDGKEYTFSNYILIYE